LSARLRHLSTEEPTAVLVFEVLAPVLALPEAMIALRELWARRGVAGHASRSRTELEISGRIRVRLRVRRS
jgi:hypothetical protein